MINLLIKDFKLMFSQNAKKSEKILSAVFVAIFVLCFVAVELFIFTMIINKVSTVAGGKEAFLSVFLFIITVLMTVSAVFSAKKLFFDPEDIEMLQDMVCAAVNEALRGVDQMGTARMSSVTGGLNIPGMR